MKKYKKIILIFILIILIVGIVLVIKNASSTAQADKNTQTSTTTQNAKKIANTISSQNKTTKDSTTNTTTQNVAKTTANVDIVMDDKTYITQINDFWANPDDYIGKTIQIEGFPLTNEAYTFVGKYGPGCCSGDGYAYMEYQYSEKLDLVDEEDWIIVIGTIKKGNDNGYEYMYIEATSVEKSDIRGNDRVTM